MPNGGNVLDSVAKIVLSCGFRLDISRISGNFAGYGSYPAPSFNAVWVVLRASSPQKYGILDRVETVPDATAAARSEVFCSGSSGCSSGAGSARGR